MFDADRPIISISQDRLDRGVFATYLARCLLDHTSPESLVVSLQGGWGSGKTSIINLVLEEIRYASNNMLDDEKPIILNFSPWSYSGQGQLIYGFFRRLASELRQAEYLENADEIIHLIELYSSFFTHHAIPKSAQAKRRLISRIKKPSQNKQELYAWESGLDPIQVKTQLNHLLKNQRHKIIIIIDNISRLEVKEINQILQIVKSMGDYFNTIYLLSMDKEQVVRAIDQVHEGEGKEYLEKLVQLPFEVPPISKQDLENLLLDRLQQIVKEGPEDSWNATYWADIYYSSLKYFFENSRDVTRYVNALSFSYPRVKEVVNPVDFFALSAIEMFAPGIFYGIRENKDLFTDLLDNVYVMDEERIKKDRARCEEILHRSDVIAKDILLHLLMILFPRLRMIYTPKEVYYHSETIARNNYRICSPDIFDVYFRLSIPTGYMPESELDTILAFAKDPESFDQALTRLNQDFRITRFLNLLDGTAFRKIPHANIATVVTALYDNGDLFPEDESTQLRFNIFMRIHRICHQILRMFPTTEERYAIMRDAIKKSSKSIYTLIYELTAQGEQHLENTDTYLPLEHRDITPDQLDKLKADAVRKIEFWASIGRLAEHPKVLLILKAWKKWGNDADCSTYVERMIQEDKGLLAFLGAALKIPVDQVMTKLQKSSDWKSYLENITDFIPIDKVEERAKLVFESDEFEKLQEIDQLAVLIFLDMINAKTVKVIPKTTV
jgi:predicted KAP-like P-loop ATPase